MINPLHIAPIRALHDWEKNTQLIEPTSLPIRQPISRIVGPNIAMDAPKQRKPQHNTKLFRTLYVQQYSRSSNSDSSDAFLSGESFIEHCWLSALPYAVPACIASGLLASFISPRSNISSFGQDVSTSQILLLLLIVSASPIVDGREGVFGVLAAECGFDLNGDGCSIASALVFFKLFCCRCQVFWQNEVVLQPLMSTMSFKVSHCIEEVSPLISEHHLSY